MKVEGRHTNLLDILDVVQLQNVSEIRTTLKTCCADISVEGGGSSRFSIKYFVRELTVKLSSLLD